MSTPKKKPRKPSVLVSRQFACANAFGGDQMSIKTSTQTVSSGHTTSEMKHHNINATQGEPKIIWKGRDVTPQRLIPQYYHQHHGDQYDSDGMMLPSLEEISALFESLEFHNEKALNQFLEKKAGIPWIPTVMRELCDECKY